MNVVPIQQSLDLGIPAFGDFWLLWPKRVARKDAERAWARLTDAQKMQAIIALVDWRSCWLARNEMDYVPHAATWLNGERWEDELPAGFASKDDGWRERMERDSKQAVPMPDHVKQLLEKLRKK